MSSLKTIVPKPDSAFSTRPRPPRRKLPEDPRQRALMVGSLSLLLLALSIVLWHDRDFWFPDSSDADLNQPAATAPAAKAAPAPRAATVAPQAATAKPAHKAPHTSPNNAPVNTEAANAPAPALETPPPVVMNSRTVLPPLEVEVVAGDTHRIIRPGSNSLHVDLQPGAPPQPAIETDATGDTETAAKVTSNAAERVQMSADTSEVVTSPVKPSYPLLARQMKVQGSVILQALIGRDGIIQNLRVVSGPHILASAAQDAVRQWHFKPHMEGAEAVETQAKITVNFTISTN
jgi:protein TonB